MDRLQLLYTELTEENEINQVTYLSSGSSNSSTITTQIYPLSLNTKLISCLKYLVSAGKQPEVWSVFNVKYNMNIINMLFSYGVMYLRKMFLTWLCK